jgi:hypothetical protein
MSFFNASSLSASQAFLGMVKHHVRAATYAHVSDQYEDQKTIESQTDVPKLYAVLCQYHHTSSCSCIPCCSASCCSVPRLAQEG